MTFTHPDGRNLPAIATDVHADNTADLVVFEGATAPFGGTSVYVDVPYVDEAPGQEPARHTWRNSAPDDKADAAGIAGAVSGDE